jgi:hypothetical protein
MSQKKGLIMNGEVSEGNKRCKKKIYILQIAGPN